MLLYRDKYPVSYHRYDTQHYCFAVIPTILPQQTAIKSGMCVCVCGLFATCKWAIFGMMGECLR